MVSSVLHVESKIDRLCNSSYNFIPISQDEEEDDEQSCNWDEFCGTPWRIARTIVGFIAIVVCFVSIISNDYNDTPMSRITPPKFFLHSLRVTTFNISQRELSATWNVDLTISNGVNSTFINFLNLNALMVYKEDIALAVSDPIQSGNLFGSGDAFFIEKNENKTLRFGLNTTGWERDQPVVDDDVIQELQQEMKLGVMSFGLKIDVEAEIEFIMMNLPVAMQSYCSNLEVDFAPLQRGQAATLDRAHEVKECFNSVDQWNVAGY